MVKKISEKLAARLRKNVVVTAGVHWDRITSNEIKTIQDLTQKLSDQILKNSCLPRGGREDETKAFQKENISDVLDLIQIH